MFDLNRPAPFRLRTDLLSGLTVALALVPEAVAFAFVAGVDPIVGLHAAFIVGLITSLFGGRPGMISGATGALAVVLVALVAEHGIEYMFAAIVLMGILQILAGVLRLGKFIRMVPHPVMLGFVNGLAIVIFMAQLGQFKTPDAAGQMQWIRGTPLFTMLALVAATMAIIHFLPKLTRAIPASLAAIVGITLLCLGLGLETPTIVEYLRTMTGDAQASLAEGFAKIESDPTPQLYLYNVDIAPYSHATGHTAPERKRRRKLLAHKRQILKLMGSTTQSGATLVPLAIFFERGRVKLEIGLATGKKDVDKRQTIKSRDADREIRRGMSKKM